MTRIWDPFKATTDEDGKFEFEGAYPKGTYTIMAQRTGHAVYSKSINLNEGAELTHNIQFQTGYEVELRLGASPVGTQFEAGSTATAKLYQGEALIQEGAVQVTADLITITFGATTKTLTVTALPPALTLWKFPATTW